jgi:nucleoside-diphosphate-sugar epimerase
MQISILGCGWLGLPLAESLVKKGPVVNGSTTSESKLPLLENVGVSPFLISLSTQNIEGDVALFLENSEILLIAIPPQIRNSEKNSFVEKIKLLLPYIETSLVKKVLFISSTSVYADVNAIVTEATNPEPDSESGKQLLQIERILQSNLHFQTTVVRFGGLIGEDRHPVHFLSGKKNIENPDAPINLIHRNDCIGILEKIIAKDIWNETFNAVAPSHPTREKYYTQKALDLKIELPEFNHANASVGKTISSDKLIAILDYRFTDTTV